PPVPFFIAIRLVCRVIWWRERRLRDRLFELAGDGRPALGRDVRLDDFDERGELALEFPHSGRAGLSVELFEDAGGLGRLSDRGEDETLRDRDEASLTDHLEDGRVRD